MAFSYEIHIFDTLLTPYDPWFAVIILEEAAYCDPGLISEVVVPLLSMSNSVLLCISTLLESGNHYSKMFDLVDDLGRKLFESIAITLVCDECLKTEHRTCSQPFNSFLPCTVLY